MNVHAVIVTYNRLEFLQKCISCLRSQTTPVKKIVVVNNGSTDGTREWLASQADLSVVNQENLGCSAGFGIGMRTAVEQRAAYVWLMDDDVCPQAGCLENLLAHSTSLSANAILVSNRLDTEGVSINGDRVCIDFSSWYKHDGQPVVRDLYGDKVPSAPLKIEGFTFEGPLIPAGVIKKVGLPNESFFIIADDTEYALRCREHGVSAFLIPSATMRRLASDRRPTAIVDKDYYMIRNGFTYLSLRYGVSPSKYVRPLVWAIILAKHRFVTSRIPLSAQGLATIVQGLVDGYQARLGRRQPWAVSKPQRA